MNIGLENNPLSYDEIIDKLKKNPNVRLGTTEMETGEYEGSPERTLIVDAKFDGKAPDFRKFVQGLSDDLTQEAIAVKYNNRGALIWGSNQTPKYDFNEDFFLKPSKPTGKFPGVGAEFKGPTLAHPTRSEEVGAPFEGERIPNVRPGRAGQATEFASEQEAQQALAEVSKFKGELKNQTKRS